MQVNHSALVALLLSSLYAISDEYHQTFVPGRNGTLADVLVDGVGMVLALGIWLLVTGRGRMRGQSSDGAAG